MRRADRLFQLLQLLRGRRVATAGFLAERLQVSERTVYRDVRDLCGSGVPIQGEAGVGYALDRSFDLPPLMFDREEVEALVLGSRVVQAWADAGLQRAAERALAKIDSVLPPPLRARLSRKTLLAPGFHVRRESVSALAVLRQAIEEQRKVRLEYRRADQTESERIVWPLGLAFWGSRWSLAAWCQSRDDFRNFRLDRMGQVQLLPERFELTEGRTMEDYLRKVEAEVGLEAKARAEAKASPASSEPGERRVTPSAVQKKRTGPPPRSGSPTGR